MPGEERRAAVTMGARSMTTAAALIVTSLTSGALAQQPATQPAQQPSIQPAQQPSTQPAQQPSTQPTVAPMPREMRIEYTAAERCPDVTFFRDRVVLKRAAHVDPFVASSAVRLVVTLTGSAGGYRGSWEAFDAAGVSVRRHDLGPVANCHDLVDGLAFGFVLRFDDPSAPQPPPSAPPSVLLPPPFVPPPPIAPKPVEPSGRVFIGAAGLFGLAVTPAPAGGGSFAMGWRARWWSLSAEVRAMVTLNAPVDGDYHVTLHRVTGALLPCLHMRFFFGCAALELGELGGVSTADVPASDSAFIATAGGRVGIEAPFSKHLAFRGMVDGFGTVKPSVIRIGGVPRWQTPAGGAVISAGLAWFF